MCLRNLHGVLRFLQVRTCDHEFLAASIYTALEDIFKVTFVSLGSMVLSSEDGVGKVDADLACVRRSTGDEGGSADQHQRNVVGWVRYPYLRDSMVWRYGMSEFLHGSSALVMAIWRVRGHTEKADVWRLGTLAGF